MNGHQLPTPTATVKAKDLEDLRCHQCRSATFYPIYRIKYLSELQSPNGQAQLIHAQIGWECSNNLCGTMLDITKSREANRRKEVGLASE